MKTDAQKEAERKLAARVIRAENYAQKREDGECRLDTCSATSGLLVVELADGTRTTRCGHHAGRATIRPYQWNEAEEQRAAA